jgi:hypothetical protein
MAINVNRVLAVEIEASIRLVGLYGIAAGLYFYVARPTVRSRKVMGRRA